MDAPLSSSALDRMIALHEVVAASMLIDRPQAQRAAASAAHIAEQFPNDLMVQAQLHWTLGSTILHQPNYEGALDHYNAALRYYEQARQTNSEDSKRRDIRIVHIPRVFCLSELGRYTEAYHTIQLAEKWLAVRDLPYARLTLLLNRSQLAGRMDQYGTMIDLADATIALAAQLGEQSRLAQGWVNRGYAAIYLGRYDEAACALDTGIKEALTAGDLVTAARGRYNRVRLLRYQGQLFAALLELQEARQGLISVPDEAATLALEEAELDERLCRLPEAVQAASFAVQQYGIQHMAAYSAEAALKALGIALQLDQLGVAQQMLQQAQNHAAFVKNEALNALIDIAHANLLLALYRNGPERGRKKNLRAARTTAQQAVADLYDQQLSLEAVRGELVVAALDSVLGGRSVARMTYNRLCLHDDKSIQLAARTALGSLLPPAKAIPHLRKATALVVDQRRLLRTEELQARYSSGTSEYHVQLVARQLSLRDYEAALTSMWEAKAGAMIDLRAVARSFDDEAYKVVVAGKNNLARVRGQLAEHQQQISIAQELEQEERIVQHMERAEAAARAVDVCEQQVNDSLRLLSDKYGTANIPSVRAVQACLPEQAVLFEFVCIEEEIIVFVLPKTGSVTVQNLGSLHDLSVFINRWKITCHRLMRQRAKDDKLQIQMVLDPIRKMLIAPLAATIATARHSIIAPFEGLHDLPWMGLVQTDFSAQHVHTVTLTPCGALLPVNQAEQIGTLSSPRILGFAHRAAQHLVYVEHELLAIQEHYPSAVTNAEAQAEDLQAPIPPLFLHIAAHAHTNSALPLCSTIELQDGPFLLLEAHRLRLHGTRLVTLSACETGVRPERGEMTLALAGAFLCAGAHGVLASLWQVDDAATAIFMDVFYSRMANGDTPASARQYAQQHIQDHYPLDALAFQLWVGNASVWQPLPIL